MPSISSIYNDGMKSLVYKIYPLLISMLMLICTSPAQSTACQPYTSTNDCCASGCCAVEQGCACMPPTFSGWFLPDKIDRQQTHTTPALVANTAANLRSDQALYSPMQAVYHPECKSAKLYLLHRALLIVSCSKILSGCLDTCHNTLHQTPSHLRDKSIIEDSYWIHAFRGPDTFCNLLLSAI